MIEKNKTQIWERTLGSLLCEQQTKATHIEEEDGIHKSAKININKRRNN
jgi:hypothetical protein